jgi:hypothetical protein
MFHKELDQKGKQIIYIILQNNITHDVLDQCHFPEANVSPF